MIFRGITQGLTKRKRTPNQFRYVPRYLKEENSIKFNRRRFRDFEDTYSSHDRHQYWKKSIEQSHVKENTKLNIRFYVILFVLVFIVFWILDFDLSIFF